MKEEEIKAGVYVHVKITCLDCGKKVFELAGSGSFEFQDFKCPYCHKNNFRLEAHPIEIALVEEDKEN